MLASAVFFYGRGNTGGDSSPASLFDAYDLIRDLVGQGTYFYDQDQANARPHLCVGAATLFAVALLAAGQVSWILSFPFRNLTEVFPSRAPPLLRRLLAKLFAKVSYSGEFR